MIYIQYSANIICNCSYMLSIRSHLWELYSQYTEYSLQSQIFFDKNVTPQNYFKDIITICIIVILCPIDWINN